MEIGLGKVNLKLYFRARENRLFVDRSFRRLCRSPKEAPLRSRTVRRNPFSGYLVLG